MSKSFRSRMGAAVRRSSTVFTISRPTTPSRRSSSDIDAASVKSASKLDTSNLAPPEPETRKVVSPIAESPVVIPPPTQSEGDTKPAEEGPSQAATSGSKPEEPATENDTNATSKAEPEQSSAPEPEAPAPEHVEAPKPVGMFTDEPEAMSTHSKDDKSGLGVPHTESPVGIDAEHMSPSAPAVFAPAPGAFTDGLRVELPPVVVAQEPTYNTEPSPAAEQPRTPSPAPAIKVEETSVMLSTPPKETEDLPVISSTPEQASPRSISYVNLPQSKEPAPMTESQDAFRHSIEENVWGAHPEPAVEDAPHVDSVHPVNGIPIIPGAVENGHARQMPEPVVLPQPQHHQAFDDGYNPVPVWKNVSAKSSTESLNANADGHKARHIVVEPNEGIALDDPFADPVPVPPVVTVQSAEVPVMPQPETHNGHAYQIQSVPSTRGLNEQGQEINERAPLLAHSMTPQLSTYSYLNNNAPAISTDPSISSAQQLHLLGWIEYALPDGTRYYVHPTLRVTTDIDLRDARLLQAVSDHLELGVDYQGGKYELHKDYELWLRNVATREADIQFSRYWVNHAKKRVTQTPPHVVEENNGAPSDRDADDHLDMEYRYWAYMESHPAHILLPQNSTSEAMEALTWSYTDQLLPSDRQDSAPFSQGECQDLMNLLRSFESSNTTGPSPVKTRVVARIHIRAAQWRQAHFRPDKPLPQDVPFNHNRHLKKRTSWGKALADVLISCLCFGIPYLLFNRSYRRIDEESGIFRPPQSGPVLVVGACTCLVAAVVLSASVTFLSLPGMDHIARIAAVVSILFSASSMVSSVVALFRYKAEVDRAMVITQALIGEGMMYEYRRSVVLSLPLVFLVYAIIGFITGIVLYSLRGAEVGNPLLILRQFDDYTRWIVIGFFGGLAGIVTTLALTGHQ